MRDLDLALQRFPLERWLASHGGEKEGKEWRLQCPRCLKEHLTVSIPRQQWRCFTCESYHPLADRAGHRMALEGAGGIYALVQWLEGLEGAAAVRRIVELSNQAEQEHGMGGLVPPVQQLEKQPCGLPRNALDLDGTVPYMVRRGISLLDFKQFGMRYVPRDGTWLQDRLLFPVWDRGRVLYWQARACWDEAEHKPRWPGDKFRKSLNPAAERDGVLFLGSSDVLGNLEQAARYPRVAIVEGPTSGIRTGPDAVWTFGKQLSPAQLALLIAAGVREVDFMWDGPSPSEPYGAWPQMHAAAEQLAEHMLVHMVHLPRGDPGEYTRDALWFHRAQAPVFQSGVLRRT